MERDRNPLPPGGPDLSGYRGATLTARFLCELAMLAALAFWGYVVGEGPWAWLLGVGAPALAAVVWGTFVAPRARVPVSAPVRVQIELALYAVAAVCLGSAGQPAAAVVLAVAGLVTSLLNDVQERRAGPDVRHRHR
ncbi:MAG TPA: YrdB family protein [Actinomycetota bacterium]|nr:YrdB family protein [Actinomycetota bacterium]